MAPLERKLREALDRQTATSEILQAIAKSPSDRQPVFDAIVRSGSRLFPGAAISVAMPIDGEVRAIAVAHVDPVRATAWKRQFPFPVNREYMHGVSLLDNLEIDIPDVANSPNRETEGARNFLATGYRAVNMMPLKGDGAAIGVLSVVREEPGSLSEEQLELLRTFAAQAVIAIENNRLVNELREKNSITENASRQLAKYMSPQLAGQIMRGERLVDIESRRKKLTVFFSDIAGFAEITEQLQSEEMTALLNEYLTEMSEIAGQYGATFDKFIGDAIMCFFGDPDSLGVREDAAACVRMAIAMQKRIDELQSGWRARGLIDRPVTVRMGINTGYCTVGNFGSPDRMDYTIIGYEVNLASRLESQAGNGEILLAAETYSLVKDWLYAEEQEAVAIKGFAQPVRTYRVRGTHEELAREGLHFHHEDEGVTIHIHGNRIDREKAREALEKARKVLE